MLIVAILIGLLLILLLALLFTPFIVRVNTQQNQYQLRWGIARVQFIPEKDDGSIMIQLPFWPFPTTNASKTTTNQGKRWRNLWWNMHEA